MVNDFERGQFNINFVQIQMCTAKMEATPRKFNFEYVFRPAYYYSRFAGLWTFSITHDSNGIIQSARLGFFDILWPIIVICLNLTLAFFANKSFVTKREKFPNSTRFIAENIFHISCFLFVIIGIVLNIVHRNRLMNVLRKLNTFDNDVRHYLHIFLIEANSIFEFSRSQTQISKLGVHFNYKRGCRRSWLYFMTPTFIALVLHWIELQFFASFYENPLLTLADSFAYDFFHFVSWISLEMSFIVFLIALHERFTAMNSLLRFVHISLRLWRRWI